MGSLCDIRNYEEKSEGNFIQEKLVEKDKKGETWTREKVDGEEGVSEKDGSLKFTYPENISETLGSDDFTAPTNRISSMPNVIRPSVRLLLSNKP